MPWHNYRGFLRVSLGDGTAMNETKDEQNAKPTLAVKHEESLELLNAFLMINDPGLRAEIISTVKKTASGQTKK
jgi:hypothetical protein